MVMGTSDG
jgi:hypothetical protein